MKKLCILLVFSLTISIVFSQEFSRKDSLRGNLTNLRDCYDVTFYDLFLIIDEVELSIEKSYNIIHFTAIKDFKKTAVPNISKIAAEISAQIVNQIIGTEVNKSNVSAIVNDVVKKKIEKHI